MWIGLEPLISDLVMLKYLDPRYAQGRIATTLGEFYAFFLRGHSSCNTNVKKAPINIFVKAGAYTTGCNIRNKGLD